jgi:hypothetical protein
MRGATLRYASCLPCVWLKRFRTDSDPVLFEHLSMRKDFENPIYRKSRLPARLILKARAGGPISPRRRRLAASLAKDADVTPRLIRQGLINYAERATSQPSSNNGSTEKSRVARAPDTDFHILNNFLTSKHASPVESHRLRALMRQTEMITKCSLPMSPWHRVRKSCAAYR